jgi:hypothetical protein
MSDVQFTFTQKLLRPIINFAVERFFPESCFYGMGFLKPFSDFDAGREQTAGYGSAMYLVNRVHDAGKKHMTIDLGGVTFQGKDIGSWKIVVERTQEVSA